MAAPEEGNVSVVVRVRPPNQREQEGLQQKVVQVVDHSMLVFDPEEPDPVGVFAGLRGHDAPRRKGKDLKFVFDRVFGEASQQQEVFQHTTRDILDGVLNGYNCSVFAYGATGAGKTHTMLGSEGDPGVMFLTMVELYRRIEEIKEEKSCEVLISYLEVYNEQIQDLLEPKGSLAIREDPQKGVVVQGLSLHQPKSAEQLLRMLANGNKNRTQHPTDANATSSRSHAVFQIYVKQHDRVAGINQDLRVAKMSLIDLAGSERASTTNAKGDRQREGANINRSLLALINVINALADAKSKKPHIPYRDSKLTRLLKDSIGGNCRTVMIAAISPSPLSYDDTYNTLKYANRAKEIKLSLKSNIISLDCHISKYAAVCEELKAQVEELRQRLQSYEQEDLGAADKEPAGALEGETTPQEADPCSRLEEPPKQAGVIREFNIGTSARRRGQQLTRRSCEEKEAEQDPQPSPKYRRMLRPRKAALRREVQQERPVSQHRTLDADQMERLVSALLRLARTQQSVLEAAALQTPEMRAEFEELEQLVCRQKGGLSAAEGTWLPPEKMDQPLGQPPKDDFSVGQDPMPNNHSLGPSAEKSELCLGQPPEKMDQSLEQPPEKIRQSVAQPPKDMDPSAGQLPKKRDQSLRQHPKKRVREVSLSLATETLPVLRPRLITVKATLSDPKQETKDTTARKRPLLKRARLELVPDRSPTLQSPIVPVKKRRRCEGSSPSKAGTPAATTPEVHAKRQGKAFLPGPGRVSLNKGVVVPLPSRSSSTTPHILADTPPKKTPLCTPKPPSGGTPKPCPSTATKGRLPLATSAIQNCATAQRPPLPILTARDLNTTFDLSEEGWLVSGLDTTVTFGPSTFPGWENVGCNLRQASGTLAPRHEVAVFTMKGPSVTRSSAPPPSTIKKSAAQRRRRSVSISTSRSMGGLYSQSRIARLHSSTVKKPPAIAERTSCSPRWQTEKKTRKGTVAFGRTMPMAPASRSLHFTAGKSS